MKIFLINMLIVFIVGLQSNEQKKATTRGY